MPVSLILGEGTRPVRTVRSHWVDEIPQPDSSFHCLHVGPARRDGHAGQMGKLRQKLPSAQAVCRRVGGRRQGPPRGAPCLAGEEGRAGTLRGPAQAAAGGASGRLGRQARGGPAPTAPPRPHAPLSFRWKRLCVKRPRADPPLRNPTDHPLPDPSPAPPTRLGRGAPRGPALGDRPGGGSQECRQLGGRGRARENRPPARPPTAIGAQTGSGSTARRAARSRSSARWEKASCPAAQVARARRGAGKTPGEAAPAPPTASRQPGARGRPGARSARSLRAGNTLHELPRPPRTRAPRGPAA